MIDIATGLSIEPPMAWTARNAISQPVLGARLHSSEPSAEEHQPGLEDPPAADPVAGRAGEHEQAGEHERVGVDRPLQAGHATSRGRAGSPAARRSRWCCRGRR